MIEDTTLRYLTIHLMLFGGILWAILGAFGVNPVSRLARAVGISKLSRVIYMIIGLAAIVFYFKFYKRDTFLPFLGSSIIPPSLIKTGYPLDYNKSIRLNAPQDATHIIYWASQGEGEISNDLDAKKAYGDYLNSGAVKVENGEVDIRFKQPVGYTVKDGAKKLTPHVHYRWLTKNGIVSPVETLDV